MKTKLTKTCGVFIVVYVSNFTSDYYILAHIPLTYKADVFMTFDFKVS